MQLIERKEAAGLVVAWEIGRVREERQRKRARESRFHPASKHLLRHRYSSWNPRLRQPRRERERERGREKERERERDRLPTNPVNPINPKTLQDP